MFGVIRTRGRKFFLGQSRQRADSGFEGPRRPRTKAYKGLLDEMLGDRTRGARARRVVGHDDANLVRSAAA